MKVLVIHTGNTGDLIFSTALFRCLKVQLEAEVFLATTPEGKLIQSENPYLDHIVLLDDFFTTIARLRKVPFSYVIDLTPTFCSKLLSLIVRGKSLRYRRPALATYLLTRFKINKLVPRNIAEEYINLVSELGVKPDDMRLDIFVPYKYEVPPDWLPPVFQKGYVAFCISAEWKTRQLPLNRMIEVCDRINRPVILIGSHADERDGSSIERFFDRTDASAEFEAGLKELNKKAAVYNACGKFNFLQEASLIKKATHVFTFDNKYLPVASAFGKETFCIYGNTVLSFGRFPYLTRFTVYEKNDLPCRPCSTTGHKKCPEGHFKCMREIDFDFYLI